MQTLAILALMLTAADQSWTLGGWTGSGFTPVTFPTTMVKSHKEVKTLSVPSESLPKKEVVASKPMPGCGNGACLCNGVCLVPGYNCINGCPGKKTLPQQSEQKESFPKQNTDVFAGKKVEVHQPVVFPSPQKKASSVTNIRDNTFYVVTPQWHFTVNGWLYGRLYNGMVYPVQQTYSSCPNGTCSRR